LGPEENGPGTPWMGTTGKVRVPSVFDGIGDLLQKISPDP